jgi:uroporphyrinogen-III synthase
MRDKFLITRPAIDSGILAAAVQDLGYDPLFAPLLDIEYHPVMVPDFAQAQALVFTSAHAVRAMGNLAGRNIDWQIPVYAVGDKTGAVARGAGFLNVKIAENDAISLNKLLNEQDFLPDFPVFHLSGRQIAAEIVISGVEVQRYVVYDAHKVQNLPYSVVSALEKGAISHVSLLSARTGAQFRDLIVRNGLSDCLQSIKLLSISEAVLESVSDLSWAQCLVAAHPDLPHMIKLIDPRK